jgi:hypothetical protein
MKAQRENEKSRGHGIGGATTKAKRGRQGRRRTLTQRNEPTGDGEKKEGRRGMRQERTAGDVSLMVFSFFFFYGWLLLLLLRGSRKGVDNG